MVSFKAFLVLATAAITQACSPLYDPDVPGGYYPPVACWQEQDTACQAWIPRNTDLVVDAKHHMAIAFNVTKYCADQIAEELARQADGRKNFNWTAKHGKLNYIGDGILVISKMSDEAVKTYQGLKYPGT